MHTQAETLLWKKVNEWNDEKWIFNGFNQKKVIINFDESYKNTIKNKYIRYYKKKSDNNLLIIMKYYNSCGNNFMEDVNILYFDCVDKITQIDFYKYAYRLDNLLTELKQYFIIKIHDKAKELNPEYFK
jgi:hypothetical protein